jgi:hypothetical protein
MRAFHSAGPPKLRKAREEHVKFFEVGEDAAEAL